MVDEENGYSEITKPSINQGNILPSLPTSMSSPAGTKSMEQYHTPISIGSMMTENTTVVDLTKDLKYEIEKCILYVCGFGSGKNMIQTMQKKYNSMKVLEDFCNLKGQFKDLNKQNRGVFDEKHQVMKLKLGKDLFISCRVEEEIILDKDFKSKFKELSKRSIQSKRDDLFASLAKILQIAYEYCGNTDHKMTEGKSLKGLISTIWRKRMEELETTQTPQYCRNNFWCPEGWLTYYLFVCPLTRSNKKYVGYEDCHFKANNKRRREYDIVDDKLNILPTKIKLAKHVGSNTNRSFMMLHLQSQHYGELASNMNDLINNYMGERHYLESLRQGKMEKRTLMKQQKNKKIDVISSEINTISEQIDTISQKIKKYFPKVENLIQNQEDAVSKTEYNENNNT